MLPLSELERQALTRRPEPRVGCRRKAAQADAETDFQRAVRSPNITIGAGYKRNLNDNSVAFGLTIPLQIFNRNEGGWPEPWPDGNAHHIGQLKQET